MCMQRRKTELRRPTNEHNQQGQRMWLLGVKRPRQQISSTTAGWEDSIWNIFLQRYHTTIGTAESTTKDLPQTHTHTNEVWELLYTEYHTRTISHAARCLSPAVSAPANHTNACIAFVCTATTTKTIPCDVDDKPGVCREPTTGMYVTHAECTHFALT